MTVGELVEILQTEFKDQERRVLVPSAKSDPLAYKEKWTEPEVFMRNDGVVIISPRAIREKKRDKDG